LNKEKENIFYYENDEIDLYELWLILKKRKLAIIGTTLLFLIVSIIYIFIATPVYKTEATLVPLEGEKGGLSSLLSSLPVPLPTQSEGISVKAVLKSRTLREELIKEFNLLPILFEDLWDKERGRWKEDKTPPTMLDGVKALKKLISVSEDKNTGTLTFIVTFPKSPELTYNLAQAGLDIADKILNKKSAKLAKMYTLYVKSQLDTAKEKYKLLEKIYKDFLEGKIKEVPFIFDERDIKLIGKISKKTNMEKLRSQFVNLPEYKFNLEKLKLQMEIASQLLATLTQQYELAKAQEQKEKVSFQVIDPPYKPDPEKPYKPKKKLIVALGLITGLFLGILLAFFKEWLNNVKNRRMGDEKLK